MNDGFSCQGGEFIEVISDHEISTLMGTQDNYLGFIAKLKLLEVMLSSCHSTDSAIEG